MSWGRSLMGSQRDCKNCGGPFGCIIAMSRLLLFLIVCRNCRRAAAMLTWGLPALGCAPPFSPALLSTAALLFLLPLLFSLSLLSHHSLFFCGQGGLSFHLSQRKSSVLWKHFTYIFYSASNLILVPGTRRTSNLRCAPPQSPQLAPIACFVCGWGCSPCTYTKHMPALKNVNHESPFSFHSYFQFSLAALIIRRDALKVGTY